MTVGQWIEKYINAETHQEKFKVVQECFDTHDVDIIMPFHAELIKDKELWGKVLKTALPD
tara:strand:- start:347 stop:526 length:180 start_codon:yes stop_codon:yes gene_type:complete